MEIIQSIVIVSLLYPIYLATSQVRGSPVTNRMRYVTENGAISPDQAFELAQDSRPMPQTHTSRYRETRSHRAFGRPSALGSLDREDIRLLNEFYRETKASDPFNALIDGETIDRSEPIQQQQIIREEGWTIDPNLMSLARPYNRKKAQMEIPFQVASQAEYSPTLRLLTSYDPVEENAILFGDDNRGTVKGSRITGATLYGRDEALKPGVQSKSANDAVRLHNNMMKKPPRDGIVRVRMYYHRAIHDDVKLYGNGPWKYWGHGWGIEFGYDPKKKARDNFYQRGYTIERAFGRDFCKDNRNCRRPDPNFFKNPHQVGDYSRWQLGSSKNNQEQM